MNTHAPVPLSFETERFLIRRYREADADLLYAAAIASIPEVFEFLPWCHPDYTRQDTADWLSAIETNWEKNNTYSFAIFEKDGSEFHGGCEINRVDEHPVGNLGYWVKTPSIGKGVATEASIHLARFGLRELGLQRIEIIMSVENAASQAVAASMGAKFEGILHSRLLLHGRPHDARIYSITWDDI